MKAISIPITMTSKGTFTLPAQVRKEFGLNAKGDRLMLQFVPGRRSAELQAPLNIRALQSEIDTAIPEGVPTLENIRYYIQATKAETMNAMGALAQPIKANKSHHNQFNND